MCGDNHGQSIWTSSGFHQFFGSIGKIFIFGLGAGFSSMKFRGFPDISKFSKILSLKL